MGTDVIKGAIDIGLPSSLFYSYFLYSRKEYFPIELWKDLSTYKYY